MSIAFYKHFQKNERKCRDIKTEKAHENFRPIALTSTVGKLFHKILAFRLEKYLIDNHWIDSKVQKGFLSGISGVLEHILSINGIIENAKSHGSPLYMTFLDF